MIIAFILFFLFCIHIYTFIRDGIPFRVFKLQIAILNTHLNGKDTHVRQVKVYSLIP